MDRVRFGQLRDFLNPEVQRIQAGTHGKSFVFNNLCPRSRHSGGEHSGLRVEIQ
jgi:hypothetical protein